MTRHLTNSSTIESITDFSEVQHVQILDMMTCSAQRRISSSVPHAHSSDRAAASSNSSYNGIASHRRSFPRRGACCSFIEHSRQLQLLFMASSISCGGSTLLPESLEPCSVFQSSPFPFTPQVQSIMDTYRLLHCGRKMMLVPQVRLSFSATTISSLLCRSLFVWRSSM